MKLHVFVRFLCVLGVMGIAQAMDTSVVAGGVLRPAHPYDSILFDAAKNGDQPLFELALRNGASLDAIDADGKTPLMWATLRGHDSLVKWLIAQGANHDIKCKGMTAADMALRYYSPEEGDSGEAIGELLSGNVTLSDYSIDRLFSDSRCKELRSWFSFNPAHKELINKKYLPAAVSRGDTAMVTSLLCAGANANQMLRSDVGATVLMGAAELGRAEVVRALLNAGALVTAKNSATGDTPLTIAASRGYDAVVKLLLQAGADPREKDKAGETALMKAARMGHMPTVQAFIDAHAFLDDADKSGNTALMVTARKGHAAVVDALIKAGANAELKNTTGETALDGARRLKRDGIIALLEKHPEPVQLKIAAETASSTVPAHSAVCARDVEHCSYVAAAHATLAKAAAPTPVPETASSTLSGAKMIHAPDKAYMTLLSHKHNKELKRLIRELKTSLPGTEVSFATIVDCLAGYVPNVSHEARIILFTNPAFNHLKDVFLSNLKNRQALNSYLCLSLMCSDPELFGKILEVRDSIKEIRINEPFLMLSNDTLLVAAIRKHELAIFEKILEATPDLEVKVGPLKRTALLVAAAQLDDPRWVQKLLDAGARADAVDSHGDTALTLAQKNKHHEVVALLQKVAAPVHDPVSVAAVAEPVKPVVVSAAEPVSRVIAALAGAPVDSAADDSADGDTDAPAEPIVVEVTWPVIDAKPFIITKFYAFSPAEILSHLAAMDEKERDAQIGLLKSRDLYDLNKHLEAQGIELTSLVSDTKLKESIDQSLRAIGSIMTYDGTGRLVNRKNTLMEACQTGDLDKVKAHLPTYNKYNSHDDYDRTPLMIAVGAGQCAVIDYLLSQKEKLDAVDEDRSNFVHYAARAKNMPADYVRNLIATNKSSAAGLIDTPDNFGVTPLIAAATSGNKAMVEVLLSAGVRVDALDVLDHQTALHRACINGDYASARLLLEHGAHIDIKDIGGNDALACARLSKCPDVITLLEIAATKKTTAKPYAAVVAKIAVATEHAVSAAAPVAVASAAIDTKRRVRTKDYKKYDAGSPEALLLASCKNGDLPLIKALIEKSPECIQCADSETGATPLMAAIEGKSLLSVSYLLDHGARIDECDAGGKTVLHKACESGDPGLAKMMAEKDLTLVWAEDDEGKKPLDGAGLDKFICEAAINMVIKSFVNARLENADPQCAYAGHVSSERTALVNKVTALKNVPGAWGGRYFAAGPIRRILEYCNKPCSDAAVIKRVYGAAYELKVADLIAKSKSGEKVLGFSQKIKGDSGVTREFDIITTRRWIECKDVHWDNIADKDLKGLEKQFADQKKIADEYGKKYTLYSKHPLSAALIKILAPLGIDYEIAA